MGLLISIDVKAWFWLPDREILVKIAKKVWEISDFLSWKCTLCPNFMVKNWFLRQLEHRFMLLLVAHYENEWKSQIFISSGTVLLIYLKLLCLIFSFCRVFRSLPDWESLSLVDIIWRQLCMHYLRLCRNVSKLYPLKKETLNQAATYQDSRATD